MDINDLAYYYYDDFDHDFISDHILDFIYDHLTLILSISFLLYFISLAIIIINGSHLKTKNNDNTCDIDNGNNTHDTDNNEDEKYITDYNENEKHITTNINKHIASIDTTLCLFLILFVFLVLTKL